MDKGEDTWEAIQTVADPEGWNEWYVRVRVPLDRSHEEQRPVLELVEIGR